MSKHITEPDDRIRAETTDAGLSVTIDADVFEDGESDEKAFIEHDGTLVTVDVFEIENHRREMGRDE